MRRKETLAVFAIMMLVVVVLAVPVHATRFGPTQVITSCLGSCEIGSTDSINAVHPAGVNVESAIGEALVLHSNGIFRLEAFQIRALKIGSPTGNLAVNVFATIGSPGSEKPTGAALATSLSISASSLTSVETTYTFQFSGINQLIMSDGQSVAFSVQSQGPTFDTSNFAELFLGSTGIADTNRFIFTNGAYGAVGGDLAFGLLGDPALFIPCVPIFNLVPMAFLILVIIPLAGIVYVKRKELAKEILYGVGSVLVITIAVLVVVSMIPTLANLAAAGSVC